MDQIQHPHTFLGGLQDDRSRGIAEEHAGAAVLVVDDAGHRICAYDHHLAVRTGHDQVGADAEAIEVAAAAGEEVEAPGSLDPEAILHQTRRGGEQHVRRDRSHDDGLDLAGVHASALQGEARRLHRHVRRGLIRSRDVALRDAGALHDPLVVGVDQLLQVGVGQQPGRGVTADGGDLGVGNRVLPRSRQPEDVSLTDFD